MGTIAKKTAFPIFNSPFELGLRMIYLLCALKPGGADLQKLVLLDYAIVYSGDLGGPASLHTPIPYRGAELSSRRELIEQGLYLMSMRGLVDAVMDETGITYFAGPTALTLVGSLTSSYYLRLEERCRWASKQFAEKDSAKLMIEFSELGHLWGAELEVTIARGKQWELS